MTFGEIEELHNITHIDNVSSILASGILSHRRAAKVQHESVSMAEIQDLRANKVVPGEGRRLHEYANLYFYAHNAMLFLRKDQHKELCVLRIDPAVLKLAGVVITDQNAASGYAKFSPSPQGLSGIRAEVIYAECWTHPENQILEWQHKSQMMAEVLVSGLVPPDYIFGAYVSCNEVRDMLRSLEPAFPVEVYPYLFFR